jgi:hypothetical protein
MNHVIQPLFRWFRHTFFKKPKPDGLFLKVYEDPETIVQRLGEGPYAPNWEQSYDKGEDINLADIRYHNDRWWQTHVRGWVQDDHVEMTAHWELEPTEHWHDHLDGVGFDRVRGLENMKDALDEAELTYE